MDAPAYGADGRVLAQLYHSMYLADGAVGSHYLRQERPAEFCALLRGWLARV
ncbi:hypothetical protein [Kutzneria sp. CA-103260]|uniref:hypothetical protein n=1 Tax=Kutzneria sp. CA-103260 TaxID=2802641 RepID=UPI001BA6AF04|nr:hypothetical protein [Kutzneria sp. CA-103260]QUQ64357.1 hypothetical protein JJ691_20770 [Kutzneria sp. CA-103260]